MAESNSLLNCRTGNRTAGSNPALSAIFLPKLAKKMANEAVRLHLTVPSGTTSHLHAATAALHSKPQVFFTSSPNSRSLACEVVSFRYRSISLVKRSACAAREVAACRRVDVFLIKSAPAGLKQRQAGFHRQTANRS